MSAALTKAHDGARILWRRRHATVDANPREGYVREFDRDGLHVRIAESANTEDRGTWYEAQDVLLVTVLAEKGEPK